MSSSVDIAAIYHRYAYLARRLPLRLNWLALVAAPIGTSLIVLLSGVLMVASAITITAGVGRVGAGETGGAVAGWLILAFAVEALGYWTKERHEAILTMIVRQLVYRRFHALFERSRPSAEARGHVLTYPAQISQFAYVVDFLVSIIQIIAFLALTIETYGLSGIAATGVIAILVAVSIKLVHLIGAVWEKYIALEGERRDWIQRAAAALPRARYMPSWSGAVEQMGVLRKRQERLLYRRVPLQVTSGLLERGALTITLAAIAVAATWWWPATSFGLGMILAARYLYAAAQNNVVNYRVIRLAVPMLRELVAMEKEATAGAESPAVSEGCPASVTIVDREVQADQVRENLAACPDAGYVPRNPDLPQLILNSWRENASPETMADFHRLALAMCLPEEVIERFWRDAGTLSSGEQHRAALALVLSDRPSWLVLDDTYSALDPQVRQVVAQVVLENVPACTYLAGSYEYVPDAFLNAGGGAVPLPGVPTDRAEAASSRPPADIDVVRLPNPGVETSSFLRSVGLLFGSWILLIVVGGLLLSGAEVAFALAVGRGESLTSRTASIAACCGVGAALGALLFYLPIYRVPIGRLGELHTRLLRRFEGYANSRLAGAVVGRLGEDFSHVQMAVPAALGSVFIVIIQTCLLLAAVVAGAPLFLAVVLFVAPLAWLVMRRGKAWILPASNRVADYRGEFLGAVGNHAALHLAPVSPGLTAAGASAYAGAEAGYIRASLDLVGAYARRTALIQVLVVGLNVSSVILALLIGETSSLVAPAAVIYFAGTLASRIQSTVETLQDVGVVGQTVERVRILEHYELPPASGPETDAAVNDIARALETGSPLVALIGPTGAGKSQALQAICASYPLGEAVIVADVDPFGEEGELSGLRLAQAEIAAGNARLILLDETLKSLPAVKERESIIRLTEALETAHKRGVIVLHSRSNLDLFSNVVEVAPPSTRREEHHPSD